MLENQSIEQKIAEYGARRLWWRCFTGMAITGLIVTLPAGIALHSPLIAASGLLKSVAYAVTKNTESAEKVTGAFFWGIFAVAVILMVLA